MTEQRVRDHVTRFNNAKRSGEWAPLIATFTEDALMSFAGVPAGPYRGRAAIAAAYDANPPTDTMSTTSVRSEGDTDEVRFAWDAGGTGTMTLRWRDGQLATLHIAFD
jgi:ketosteroid isomerase-like protein